MSKIMEPPDNPFQAPSHKAAVQFVELELGVMGHKGGVGELSPPNWTRTLGT